MKAPKEIVIKFCPKCGRNDRITPLAGKRHSWGGLRCDGQPVDVVYVPRKATNGA